MLDLAYDPYECHARHFLSRLQEILEQFSKGDGTVNELIPKLDKRWPQVLVAFWWASQHGSESGNEIRNAFLACAGGDIAGMQFRRGSLDLQQFSESIRATAQRQQEPNDAAFLYRFAGIAKVQAGILKIAEDTGTKIREILDIMKRRVTEPHPSPSEEDRQSTK